MDIDTLNTAFGNTEITKFSRKLLDDLQTKRISYSAFMRACAYWALQEGFDELCPKAYPTPPRSRAYEAYMAKTTLEREKIDAAYFNKYSEIMRYFHQKNFIKKENEHKLEWLREIRGYIDEQDTDSFEKIDTRINEFIAFIDPGAERLRTCFDGEVQP